MEYISDMLDRVAPPNLDVPAQVQAAALALINTFTSDLFDYIDFELSNIDGQDWLTKIKLHNINVGEINYRDPSVLLKEIINQSQSPLRIPIRKLVPQKEAKSFYDRLSEILTLRNQWVHISKPADTANLEGLAVLIHKVSDYLKLSVVNECRMILNLVNKLEINLTPGSGSIASESLEVVELTDLTVDSKGDKSKAPSKLEKEKFSKLTYVLSPKGSLKDKGSGLELLDSEGNPAPLVAELLKLKPSGGRLRITKNGGIHAYIGNSWDFLYQVKSDEWFPGHLNQD